MLVLLAGCELTPEVTRGEDIIALTFPERCVIEADGTTSATVTVGLIVPSDATIAEKVEVALRLDGATWNLPEDSSDGGKVTAVDLGKQQPRSLRFRPSTRVGPVTLQASLGGFLLERSVLVTGARVREVVLNASPASFGPGETTLALEALVRTVGGGTRSDGTRVRFRVVQREPPGAFAELREQLAPVDVEGLARATLEAGDSLDTVVVEAAVEVPTPDGCSAVRTQTATRAFAKRTP